MNAKAWIVGIAMACGATLSIPYANAEGTPHEKTVGLVAGYVSQNNSAIAGIDFSYRFSRRFRLAPQALYAFRHNKQDALIINVNAQIPFDLGKQWEIYPLAGINYTSWNFHANKIANDDADVTSRVNRFGLNVGAGAGVNISSTLRLGIEGQWALVKDYQSANILAKIAYIF